MIQEAGHCVTLLAVNRLVAQFTPFPLLKTPDFIASPFDTRNKHAELEREWTLTDSRGT